MNKSFRRGVGITGVALVVALVVAGCSGSSSSDGVEIQDAWARTTAPGQTMGAVYMEIESADGDEITGASVPSSIAGKTELHETRDSKACEKGSMGAGHSMEGEGSMDMEGEGSMDMEGEGSMDMEGEGSMDMDSMKCMKQVKSIDLPAGETVSLEPGGFHVMLLDLGKPIEEGETFEVTLSFAKGDDTVAEVTARNEE